MVIEITDQNFEEEVLKSNSPVLVDLYTPWCGPCRMVSPLVERLSQEYVGKFKFCKLNVNEAPQITFCHCYKNSNDRRRRAQSDNYH